MSEISDFGLGILVVSATVFVALLGMRVGDRLSIPYAGLFLVGSALVAELVPSVRHALSIQQVERIAVVALVVILFDGGLHIGLRRFRRSAGPILALGVVGTFVTAGIVALAARYVLGFSWTASGLVGAAIAPTDPAVTFSLFGGREIRGRAGTILEGEAGTNDPVGIALMIGMIEVATDHHGGAWTVASEFLRDMGVGLAVGVAGALLLLSVLRRVRLTGPALYPIRVLAGAGVIYGLASVLGGSGFLAVFVAGVILGDASAPRKGEIEGFHASLAGLAEIAAFVALGLSIGVGELRTVGVWGDGLVLAIAVALVARPLAVFPLLLPANLHRRERLFVAWAGLKGAVPILLGALAVLGAVDGAARLYGIVFVVVLCSVLVQGTSVPFAARVLGISFRRIDHDLDEARELVVHGEATARGLAIGSLPLGERAWVGGLVRNGAAHRIADDVVLEPGDRVLVYGSPADAAALERIFSGSG